MAEERTLEQALAEAAVWTPVLYAVQGGRDPERRAAALRFREAAAPLVQAGDAAVPLLARETGDPLRQMTALRILALIPTPASLRVLQEAASARDLARASSALQAIRQITPSESLVPALLDACRAAQEDRICEPLLAALLRSPGAEVGAFAESLLKTDPEARARERIAREAGRRADRQAVALLTLALQDRSASVRNEALFGLALQGDRARAAELVQAFGVKSTALREQALSALARLSLPEGVGAARRALDDPSPLVRNSALLALVFLGDRSLFAELPKRLQDSNAGVAHQAEAVFADATGETMPFPPANAPAVVERVVAGMEPGRRYFRGRPWTVRAMVDTLTNPLYAHYAAPQLVSATGQRHGFDPDRDLLANLDALAAWERWADVHEDDYRPGCWYYQGQRID
jgi:hypothetical protein